MALRAVKEVGEHEVVLLYDADVEFVSLVRHGANQMPFKVIKDEAKGGDTSMSMVVQSIIVPKQFTIDALMAEKDLAWLNDAKLDAKEETNEHVKYVQLPMEKFAADSLQLAKLREGGVFAIVGKLAEGVTAKDALSLGSPVQKVMEIQPSPMDAPVAQYSPEPYVLTFRDMFESELYSFIDVIRGSMNLSNLDTKTMKATVLGAADAFRAFLSSGLDAIGSKKGKSEAEKVAKWLLDIFPEGKRTAKTTEVEDMDLFKTKEEFVEAVAGVLDAMLTKKEQDQATIATKEAEAAAKLAQESSLATALETVKTLETAVATLTAKTAELGAQLGTEPAGETHDDPGKTEAAKEEERKREESIKLAETMGEHELMDSRKKPIDKSVFNGILTVSKEELAA